MENENLRGEDPVLLASDTRELYKTLGNRSKRFGELFAHYVETFQG